MTCNILYTYIVVLIGTASHLNHLLVASLSHKRRKRRGIERWLVPCSVPCAYDWTKKQTGWFFDRSGMAAVNFTAAPGGLQARLLRSAGRASKGNDIVTVSDISEAKQRRARICEVADWVVDKVPWTIAIADWPGFSEQWPALTAAELADVERELHSRGEALCADDTDLASIAARLNGHPSRWTAAADWLSHHIGRDMTDAEFCRLFGKLSRGELILAAIEHRRRLSSRSAI